MQRASFICRLHFLLLRKGQSIYFRALLSNLCLEGAKVYLASPAEQPVQKDGSWEVLGEDLGKVGAGKGCWGGSPGFWGSCEGAGVGHFIRQLAHLAAWAPWPLSPQQPGCLGCRRQGAGPPQLLAQRVCQAESGKLAACTVPLRWLVTSTRHPNDSPWGGQAGDAFCFSLGQPGHRPYLFPQLVLVDDAFQLLRQLWVLLAELHVPLALLLDLSLDFTQCALEMISYFFPLLLFLPCPLNCFLLLLNGREQCHVRKMHNKRFQKDTVSE